MTWCFLTNMRFIGELLVRIDKFNIEWLVPKSNRNIITYRLCHAQLVALWRVPAFLAVSATLKADRAPSRALARHSMAKKIFRRPKSHYTAPTCGFWIIKIFQFYFSSNQTAWPHQCWRLSRNPKLKRLKRISVFFIFEYITNFLLLW